MDQTQVLLVAAVVLAGSLAGIIVTVLWIVRRQRERRFLLRRVAKLTEGPGRS